MARSPIVRPHTQSFSAWLWLGAPTALIWLTEKPCESTKRASRSTDQHVYRGGIGWVKLSKQTGVSEFALMEKKMSGERHGASVIQSLRGKGRVLLDGHDFVA